MPLIPDTKLGKIQFCEQHVTPWTANSVAMGSSAAAVTAWNALVTAARTKYNEQQAAQIAAKDATIDLNVAMQSLMDATSSIIKQVRAKADLSGDGIYALASLPVPATPSPVGPPGTPEALKVTLNQDGSIRMIWKCPNPPGAGGTLYHVFRSIGLGNEFTFIGGAGTREFTDDTVPTGESVIVYKIQGVRTTQIGPDAQFIVRFGTTSSGGMTATVEPVPQSPKLAA